MLMRVRVNMKMNKMKRRRRRTIALGAIELSRVESMEHSGMHANEMERGDDTYDVK